ncbi:hypothetical protein CBOM_01541 [Ceraceosorus bombacis]|uniref:Uncharacterized protein n=1 Tax=Ceraceosorus bombacis TaxID=401625 RepID=A0A0P1BC45_9BASI|nr:hypothetical protein CBOM_01541 [Ceraceosorus bombacis]
MGLLHLAFDNLTTTSSPLLRLEALQTNLTPALYRSPAILDTSVLELGFQNSSEVATEAALDTMHTGASPLLQDSHLGEETSSFTFSWTPLLGGSSAFGPWELAANADHGALCSALIDRQSNFSEGSSSNSDSSGGQPGSPSSAPNLSVEGPPMSAWNDVPNRSNTRSSSDASDDEALVEDVWPESSNGRSLRRVRRTAFNDTTGATNDAITASGGGSNGIFTPVTLVAPAPKIAAATSEATVAKLCSVASPPELRLAIGPNTTMTSAPQSAWADLSQKSDGEKQCAAFDARNVVAPNQVGSARTQNPHSDAALELSSSTAFSSAQSSTGVGALFQRRAHASRAGDMPAPKPIGTSTLSGAFTTPLSAAPLPAKQHSQARTATFPLSQTWDQLSPEQQSRVIQLQSNIASEAQTGAHRPRGDSGVSGEGSSVRAAGNQAALIYPRGRQDHASKPQGPGSSGFAYTSMGLLTPISPVHALAPSSAQVPSHHFSPASSAFRVSTMPSDMAASYGVPFNMNTAVIGSNALGLSQPFPGTNGLSSCPSTGLQAIDPSSFGAFTSEYPDPPASLFHKERQSSHAPLSPRSPNKAKSAPNLRSVDPQQHQDAPSRSPRKIASNRRLHASSNASTMPTETSPASSFNSGRPRTMTLSSASSGYRTLDSPSFPPTPRSGGSISFVNYGIEDADELCAAVAPSGSYKIPLRGYGSAGDIKEAGEKGAKAAKRDGPRWEERKDSASSSSVKARAVKRRKSVPNLAERASAPKEDIPPVPPLPPAFAAAKLS